MSDLYRSADASSNEVSKYYTSAKNTGAVVYVTQEMGNKSEFVDKFNTKNVDINAGAKDQEFTQTGVDNQTATNKEAEKKNTMKEKFEIAKQWVMDNPLMAIGILAGIVIVFGKSIKKMWSKLTGGSKY